MMIAFLFHFSSLYIHPHTLLDERIALYSGKRFMCEIFVAKHFPIILCLLLNVDVLLLLDFFVLYL